MTLLNERLKNNRIVRHLYYFTRGVIGQKKLKDKAGKTIDIFGLSFDKDCHRDTLINDMVRMNKLYGFDFAEYLYYHFADKSMAQRLSFVADWEHLGYACAFNDAANDQLFDNKWYTYNRYKKYYGREILFCQKDESAQAFEKFVQQHNSFMVKPLDLSCGNGIQIINKNDIKETSGELYEKLIDTYQGKFVIEQLIIQADEMARFHPNSVNTLRMPTIRLNDETLIFNPVMRIGRGGNIVDNAGAGGIICSVDVNTGEIFAAADEYGNQFTKHPDTNEQIVGAVVPHWQQAKDLVKELAAVVATNRYTGWDIALSNDGWVMVEANRRGQFIWQISSQLGCRAQINELLKKINKKY